MSVDATARPELQRFPKWRMASAFRGPAEDRAGRSATACTSTTIVRILCA